MVEKDKEPCKPKDNIQHTSTCATCQKRGSNFKRCSKCKAVHYCSQICQHKSWKDHKPLCEAIHKLERDRRSAVETAGQYQSRYTPVEYRKLVKLVGKKSLVDCCLNGKSYQVLWDTGANISIISQKIVQSQFPFASIHKLDELLEDADSFRVQWGNQSDVPYMGWVELSFKLENTPHKQEIQVPFLVTEEVIESPILGTNAIEVITRDATEDELKMMFSGRF